jgi:membrane protein implicated in regulation of membrane protease activity
VNSSYVIILIESLIHNLILLWNISSALTIMRMSSSLPASQVIGIALIAAAIVVIILASNFTIINAQQLTSQSGEIENGTTAAATTTFQSTNDSFRVQVPEGWVIHDLNNTGSALLEESTRGYGLLAQLCPEEEQQQQQGAPPTNASGGGTTNSSSGTSNCQGAQEVIYVIRYPDLDTRIPAANNVTTATTNNNMTTDNVLSYHLQKLQEVGYRSVQIVNSTEVRLNLTNPQTNETIATVPSRLVEMAYSTTSAPNETRTGYFISTATNATPPNLGTTKGYAVFYEGNSTTNTAVASGSLAPTPLPPSVGQVLDSFELIAASEVAQEAADEAQAAQTAENDDDDGADNNGDDDGADNNGDDDGADNNGDDDGADGNEGEGNASPNDPNEFEDCIIVGDRPRGVVGC